MYRQYLALTIATIYALCVLEMGVFEEDTFMYNMYHDSDCFAVQHVQYEDGSCRTEGV